MNNKRSLIYITFFLVLVLAVWAVLGAMPDARKVELPHKNDMYTISSSAGTIYQTTLENWQSWPEELYTPEDFETGNDVSSSINAGEVDYEKTPYVTHRLTFTVDAGQNYAISLRSSDYAMRFFIDDEQVGLIGKPAATVEAFIPRTLDQIYYFTPTTHEVTMTVQTANFVHKDGCYPPVLLMGNATDVVRHTQNDLLSGAIILGCLLMAGGYHFALFLLNRQRKSTLVFAVCCILLMFLTRKLVPLFFPGYNWDLVIRLEYTVHVSIFAMLTLFLDLLFPTIFHRLPMRIYHSLCAAMLLCVWIAPSLTFTRILTYFDITSIVMIGYVMVCLGMSMRSKRLQNILAFVGVFAICLLGINDILYVNGITFLGVFLGQVQTTPIGMVLFVFCYALVISMEHAETQRRIEQAHKDIANIQARYDELADEQSAQSPSAKLESFGLSVRETEVVWLLLDGKQRIEIADTLGLSRGSVNTYCTRIYQKTGCAGMAELWSMLFMQNGKM